MFLHLASRGVATVASASINRFTLAEATPAQHALIAGTLAPFMKEERVVRMREVLDRRRRGVHLVLENVADPFNCAAVMRTAEGLGVQHVHVIESVSEFTLPAAEASVASRGFNSRTVAQTAAGSVAMGASRWLTLSKYRRSIDCYEALREAGCRIVASDCPPATEDEGQESGASFQTIKQHEFDAKPIDALSFEAGKPVALVFGNERRGVSRQFVERADDAFYLPMGGFTQSFNISVACAMALYAAIASGAFAEGTLTEAERDKLLALWLLRDVKAARPILRQAGIELDDF